MTKPSFQDVQYTFAAHLRDPDKHPAPGDVDGSPGLALYRELVMANMRMFIGDNFPVIRTLMADDVWEAMVRDYFARHINRTPIFSQLPTEFLDYLEKERNEPSDPPFLWELAHYEWMESALRIDSNEIRFDGIDRAGDLLDDRPALSPLAWPLAYRFPVHRLSRDYRPSAPPPQPTYLVIYRDEADKVGFLELNPVSARLLELIANTPSATGRDLLKRIAIELQHPDPEVVVKGGLEIMKQWRERQVLLGTHA